jgi:hypothetical protein
MQDQLSRLTAVWAWRRRTATLDSLDPSKADGSRVQRYRDIVGVREMGPVGFLVFFLV